MASIPTMIVDDESDMRTLLRAAIDVADLGLEVACEAASGEEALSILDHCGPAVVVLDQMMPGLSGTETAVLIRQRRPDVRMILWSGYLDTVVIEEAKAAGVEAWFKKDAVTSVPVEAARLVEEPPTAR